MLVFHAGDGTISANLELLVQAWIMAERTSHRFLIDWPTLPTDRLTLRPFYDAHKCQTSGALHYSPNFHRREESPHLLQYYYRRIFTQLFLIHAPTLLPYCHKSIALWKTPSLPFYENVVRHHWCKNQIVYRFATGEVRDELPFLPGVVNVRQHEQILPAIENWTSFFHLGACNVIVSERDPLIETVIKCFRHKEYWMIGTEGKITVIR